MAEQFDAAVVGAGVVGLAQAYHLAKAGLRVAVFERHPRAQGASVRNFGMLWPVGQPAGEMYRLARHSLEHWLEVLPAAGLWHARCGSLHLAYHEDEAAVLGEFAGSTAAERGCQVMSAAEVHRRFPAINSNGLHAGLWSPTEVTVDPREVIARLPDWLARTFGVIFRFDCPVLGYDRPRVTTAAGDFEADRLVVCTGIDFRELAPEAFANSGLVPCKLQMMRTPPLADRVRLGTMLAAGLTLRHYKGFASCPSLPAVVRRLDAELPDYGRYGIHVMAAQNGKGEIVLGDSHEYGDAATPFDNPVIDDLILAYLRTFLAADLPITARWHGVYAKHPTEPFVIARPRPGLTAVTGLGGAGMTLSFGLAERVTATVLEDRG